MRRPLSVEIWHWLYRDAGATGSSGAIRLRQEADITDAPAFAGGGRSRPEIWNWNMLMNVEEVIS